MRRATLIDSVLLLGFLALCIWEWRRDVRKKRAGNGSVPALRIDIYQNGGTLEQQFTSAGWVETGSGVFTSPDGQSVVTLSGEFSFPDRISEVKL
jgi:hypothetical protein